MWNRSLLFPEMPSGSRYTIITLYTQRHHKLTPLQVCSCTYLIRRKSCIRVHRFLLGNYGGWGSTSRSYTRTMFSHTPGVFYTCISHRGKFRRGPTPLGQRHDSRGMSVESLAEKQNRHPLSDETHHPRPLPTHDHPYIATKERAFTSADHLPSGTEINSTISRPRVPLQGRCLFNLVWYCPESSLYYLKQSKGTYKI